MLDVGMDRMRWNGSGFADTIKPRSEQLRVMQAIRSSSASHAVHSTVAPTVFRRPDVAARWRLQTAYEYQHPFPLIFSITWPTILSEIGK